jgi:hypothetical protein
MKLKLIILLTLFSLTTKAIDFRTGLMFVSTGGYLVGINHLIDWERECVTHDWQRNGILIPLSIDPKMLLTEGVDFKIRPTVRIERLNFYTAYEVFDVMNFEAWTAGVQYKLFDTKLGIRKFQLSVLAGVESGCIHNQDQYVWTNGVDLRLEHWFHKNPNAVFINMGYRTRPELTNPYVKLGALSGCPDVRIGLQTLLR